jgi:hypothetical protein
LGVLLSLCLFLPAVICSFRSKDKGIVTLVFCLLTGCYLQSNLSSIVIVQDFVQYCETIDSIRMNRAPLYGQRSVASLYPAAILSNAVGIIDAIIIVNSIALWGTIIALQFFLQSLKQSKWMVFPVVICFPPVMLMSSMLDSTPVIVMTMSWASVLAFVGVNKKRPLLIGVALGLALLIDVRGLLWSLPIVCCWGISIFTQRKWKHFFIPALPLLISYRMAMKIPAQSISLEEQIWWFYQERMGHDHPVLFYDIFPHHNPFIWGHSPLNWLGSLNWVLQERPSMSGFSFTVSFHWWLGGLLVLILFSLMNKNFLRNVTFLLVTSPFMLLLYSGMLYQPNWRRMAVGWVAAVLIILYAFPQKRRIWLFSLGGLLIVLTPIEINYPVQQDPDIGSLIAIHPNASQEIPFRDPQCERALSRDIKNGIPWGGRIYSMAIQRRYITQ